MPKYIETFRATVAPADCDHLGHMNVQHYFAAVSDGVFAVMVQLGLGPREIRERKMSFAVVHAETEFQQELHAGDVIVLESTVEKLGTKSALRHPLILNPQMTPNASRNTRCSWRSSANFSSKGRRRSSGQLGIWS